MQTYIDSLSKDSLSNKKIRFSECQHSLNYQSYVPFQKYDQPIDISKRKKYSMDQNDTHQYNFNLTRLRHSQSDNKIITKPQEFNFRIQAHPKINKEYFSQEHNSLGQQIKQKSQTQIKVQKNCQTYHIQQIQPRQKIPIWILVLIGIIVLIVFGWFISRMFFTKIKMSKHPQNAIFQRYLLNLTDYQVQKMQVYKPIILRQNFKWGFWRIKKSNTIKSINSSIETTNTSMNNGNQIQKITESSTNPKLKHLYRYN